MDRPYQARVWLGMAEIARRAADSLDDEQLKLQMLSIAAAYEAMTRRAQALAAADTITDKVSQDEEKARFDAVTSA